ncbi:MAG: helix-turn-helix domain-containing protein [Archaeoglobaceae archaeon]
MYVLSIDLEQYDCPFINNSSDFDVFYYMPYWDFKNNKLINWGYIFSPDSEELHNSLSTLPKQRNFLKLDLLAKSEKECLIKTEINFTNAMSIIRKNSGCICGPFLIKNGHEIWHVAFEDREKINSAITELSKENEIIRIEEVDLSTVELQKLLRLAPILSSLILTLENLNSREKEILYVSIENGFFDDPKKIRIQELAKKLDLSKGIISRKLREIEKKIFQEICKILSTIEVEEQTKKFLDFKTGETNFKAKSTKLKKFRKF